MKHSIWYVLVLAILLAGCAPGAVSTQPAVAVPPTAPTEVVITMQPAATETAPAATLPATEPAATEPAATEPAATPWIAYLADDGDIWIVNPASGEMRQITQDGTPMNNAGGGETIFYGAPKWSSDGQMLATERQVGTPVTSGYQYSFSLLVYDMQSMTARTLLDGTQTAGFTWAPGTRQIAYGLTIPGQYFSMRGAVDASYARGIWTVNVDTGETSELVKPERGFSLVNPNFSPDGTKVAFDEVYMMEGQGKFAYYDLSAQQYNAWDKPIGGYRWTPDGQGLVYDYMVYMPSGEESIFINNLQGDAEQELIPASQSGSYAYGPAFSPDGSQIAYIAESLADLTGEGHADTGQVMIISTSGGEPRPLGAFELPGDLRWSADGQSLLLSVGPWFNGRQVALLSVKDGTLRPLTTGTYGAWQPVP